MIPRSRHPLALSGLLAALLAPPAAGAAGAGDFPSRPIRVLVPFAPGGVVDTSARIVTVKIAERLGWQFVIDNRPGGNGFIAVQITAKATPDGYTLLMAHTGEFAVNPAVFKNVPYDLERDFTPVGLVSENPMVILASAQSPIATFKDLIAQAKANPGKIAFSSPGTGSINHLAGEWLGMAAGVKLLHVPYKGGAPAAAAVAAGEIPLGVVALPGAIPHLKSGRVKVVGVTTARRSQYDTSWITAREAGIPDVDAGNWVGLFAPKGTPKAVIDRINGEVLKVLALPDVRTRFTDTGVEPGGSTPAEFLARIRQDAARFKKVVEAAGVKTE
jgi:tripartite-type tricarboxylate transporter receptor subunit TctC